MIEVFAFFSEEGVVGLFVRCRASSDDLVTLCSCAGHARAGPGVRC
jgi:hypothetical protein